MRTVFTLLVLVTVLPGCTFSVHPIMTDADLTKDLDLSGTWQQQMPPGAKPGEKPIVVSCEGYHENTSYDAIVVSWGGDHENTSYDADDEGGGQEFDVQIGKIGEGRYLQFMRRDVHTREDCVVLAMLPVYGFARFDMKNDELHVYSVNDRDEGKLLKLLQNKDVPYREYEPQDLLKWCILTAPTCELRSLIRSSSDELFLKSPMIFRRVPSPERNRNGQSHGSESSDSGS